MNLASQHMNSILPSKLGGSQVTAVPDFDLNDKTFSDILDKQMDNINPAENTAAAQPAAVPNGFGIEELISMQQANLANENAAKPRSTEPISKIDFNDLTLNDEDRHVTNSEMLTFFTSLLGNENGEKSNNISHFVRKQVTNFYGKHAGSVVTSLGEFVSDALNLT